MIAAPIRFNDCAKAETIAAPIRFNDCAKAETIAYCKAAIIAALGGQAIKPKGIETMLYYAANVMISAAVIIGFYGVYDAVRNYKGNNNG